MDPIIITLIAGFVIPAIVAAVTKSRAHPVLKTGVTAVLSAAATASAVFITGGIAVFSAATLKLFASAFASALVSYQSLWKQLHVNEKVAPDKGLS